MVHVRHIHWDEARRLFSRALAAGGTRKGFSVVEWDVSGNCQSPYQRISLGRPRTEGKKFFTVIAGKTRTALEVRMVLPCSHCDKCRKRLANKWRRRATAELEASSRSWFGTLTFRPSERYRLLAAASAEYGPGFSGLPEKQQFRLIERQGYKEVCKYWKRVRKDSGVRLRYILVAEAHSDGSLHYHALVHERGNQVRHHQLSKQWWGGFSKWKLVDKDTTEHRTAWYVTKYLTKSNLTRTRASVGYGQFSLQGKTFEGTLERNDDSQGESDHLLPTFFSTARRLRKGRVLATALARRTAGVG